MSLICFTFSEFGPWEKVNYEFCLLNFVKVVLDSVSFWDPESSKDQIEAYLLTKLAFATNKCLAQDAFGKCPKTKENLSKYRAVIE